MSTPASDAPGADRPFLEAKHPGLLMAAVMAISMCQFLDLTIANVALPHMQTSLNASMESISWVLTSFIIAGVLILPLTGWLSDKIGSRNLFLWASTIFVLSSMLCGAATSLTQMVIFRAIQGMAAAMISPIAQTIMLDINRPSRHAKAMAIWGMVVMIGPISGPFLGGFLTENLSWRWVFYVNLPIGIPAIIILWWLLPSRQIVERKLDVFGAVMLGLGLVALQLMLDRGQHKDWLESTEIVFELLFALSAFWIFAVHTRTVASPLFDGRMVRDVNFQIGIAFMILLGVANVALSAILPSLLQSVYRYDVMTTGLLLAPRGLGVMLTMLLANIVIAKVDSRVLIALGFAISSSSLWMMSGWSLEMGWEMVALAGFVQGLGIGFMFVPVNLVAFSTIPTHFRTEGATLLTLARNLGSSFGISVIVTLLARNIQISHADIGATVTETSIPAFDPGLAGAVLGPTGSGLLALIDGEVNRQAAMIAYIDNFYLLFWVMICFVPITFLIRNNKA